MSQSDYYIKYRNNDGELHEAFHDNVEIYRQHRKSIADNGGLIVETRGPKVQEGTIQILVE